MHVGVIGLGKIAQLKYLPQLAATEDVDLHVCDVSTALTRALAERYAVPTGRCYEHHQQMFDRGLDLVFVLTHNHHRIALDACAARIPLFVEKPLDWTVPRAQAVVDAARRHGTPLCTGYMRRHDPCLLRLRDLIRQRAEAPVMVDLSCLAGGVKAWTDRLYAVEKPTPGEKAAISGQLDTEWSAVLDEAEVESPVLRQAYMALVQLGIHQLNAIRFILGDSIEVLHATCHTSREGVSVVGTELSASGVHCRLQLAPMFQAPWPWKETVDVTYANARITASFGNPFLASNEGHVRIEERDGSDFVQRVLDSSRIDPFKSQLERDSRLRAQETVRRVAIRRRSARCATRRRDHQALSRSTPMRRRHFLDEELFAVVTTVQ